MDDNYNTSTIRQNNETYINNYKHNECMVLNVLHNITQAMNSFNVYWYSKPSSFTGITFLKNPVNSATMVHKVKTL